MVSPGTLGEHQQLAYSIAHTFAHTCDMQQPFCAGKHMRQHSCMDDVCIRQQLLLLFA